MKKLLSLLALFAVVAVVLTGCNDDDSNGNDTNDAPETEEVTEAADDAAETNDADELEIRVYDLDRLVVNEGEEEIHHGHDTPFSHAVLTFVGEEQGGNVIMELANTTIHASINPSREHPSFESGYWHHHLYAGSTQPGSPRINFQELLPGLGIDNNPEATDDNTQSAYQHGNLHYIVETGEFRLRFTIGGGVIDLMFAERIAE
ncbi:MAG: hypothetical protein FWE07_06295 [Turicibacter sp.]|nr:hypothetical protein [Turicibacter sp.]